ncbi:MAG: hypothetical protein RJA61_548 [Candidatus Parcubacteria bacterium]|jgi:phosphopantetheinyl transferase (holo-ACP synthase)
MSFIVSLPQKRKITRGDVALYLTSREQIIYTSFSNKARAYMWFTERIATKKAIQLYFKKNRNRNIPWNMIDISERDSGTPIYRILKGKYIREEQQTNISFSHVRNIAIGGIAQTNLEGSLGVHVEKVRNFRKSFLKAFLEAREIEDVIRYKKIDNRNIEATILWSIKEACLKSEKIISHPKDIIVLKISKNYYEIYDAKTKHIKGYASSWSPQKGFVASKVYKK